MFKQWVIFKALIIEILLVVMLPPVNLQTHIDLEGFKALFSKVGDFLKKKVGHGSLWIMNFFQISLLKLEMFSKTGWI